MEKFHVLSDMVAEEIEKERLGAAALFIKRGNQILADECFGSYRPDTIYKLFSMTKIITAVGVMKLIEEGRVSPDDKVSEYFPSFSRRTVLRPDGTVARAQIPLRISHLLNMTSGIGYPAELEQEDCLCLQFERRFKESHGRNGEISLQEYCESLAEVPAAFEAGDRWKYGASADLLGGIIEKVTSMSVAEYFRKVVFAPLEMKDTAFCIPEDKAGREADCFMMDHASGKAKKVGHIIAGNDGEAGYLDGYTVPGPVEMIMRKEPVICSCGGGLYSTVQDYQNMMQMLLHKGVFKGKKFLKEETVRFMLTPQMAENVHAVFHEDPVGSLWPGYSYSNLVRILEKPEKASQMGKHGNPGEFGWDGLAGNVVWGDPKEQITGIFMIQMTNYVDFEFRGKLYQKLYQLLEG